VPTHWEHVPDLPRNALGKVLRRQLILARTTPTVEKY
jgi:acyl-coenzyme A synthetase/AMP-(fatty) acid ligase